MKALFSLLLVTMIVTVGHAQEGRPVVPPPKNTIPTKRPTLPPATNKPIEPILINSLPNVLIANSWNLTRWWTTGNIGHSTSCPGFKFLAGGVINCNCYVADAKAFMQNGVYSIRGNNVSITVKKDNNIVFSCSLVYNSANRTLTGTYTLQVFAIPDPPQGYMPGATSGDMKLEIQ